MTGNEALKLLTKALDDCGLAYMVVGSYSSNYYGLPRSTQDADLVMLLEEDKFSELIRKLPEGLHLDQQSSFEMVTATRRDIVLVEGSGFKIELFHLSDDPHDQLRFAKRVRKNIGEDWAVWLPEAEDVIIQKLRWCKGGKRQKDFDDVLSVLGVNKVALDFDYIRKWCADHDTLDILAEAREMTDG